MSVRRASYCRSLCDRLADCFVESTASRCILSLVVVAIIIPSPWVFAQTPTPVIVPTWRYDITHAGQNTNETALTPSNVNVNSFRKLFSVAVDSTVYAQPLYVPGLAMNDGNVHNVLFVATENDSIYAFDADSNTAANASPLWKITLLDAEHGAGSGAKAVNSKGTAISNQGDIGPTIGITGTPVINPNTNTMYVVGNTEESGAFYSRLHAINILTGAEQTSPTVQQSPVTISATVAGTGQGSSGGKLAFNALMANQRPALNYYKGSVYIGYSSHGDIGPWHGWLFAYNATTMQQSAVICLSPNGTGASLWGSGTGFPIDDDATGGRMFIVTGNGTFDANYPPFTQSSELGESIVQVNLANGGLTPQDAFTSFNAQTLNDHDDDQGSGGILMVPDQQGSTPHVMVQEGKEGRILVLNRDHLGSYASGASSNTNILQDIPKASKGTWSTAAYWNGHVYIWGSGDQGTGADSAKMFSMTDGVLSDEPTSVSSVTSQFPGASFSISSNGTADGIAWAVRSDGFNTNGPGILYAWDANDLTNILYESDTNASRDSMGTATKFSVPVVTNGKVYAVARDQVDVFGLTNYTPTVAAPSIQPNGGTFYSSQNVTLSTVPSTAQIFYTLDNSNPTPQSSLYSDPITVSANTTVNAIATAPGYVQSSTGSAVFTFPDQPPAVTFSPAAGTYTTAQNVKLLDGDSSASIYYTTDGTPPSSNSTSYTGAIPVSAGTTINAIAVDTSLGTENSNVSTAAYVIQPATAAINFGSGFASTTGLTLNGKATTSNAQLLLVNGVKETAGSVFWNKAVGVQAFTTSFTFQLSKAIADGFTFTIQNDGPKTIGGNSAGLGYAGIKKSVAVKFDLYSNAGEGTDSTGVFTNGALPTVPAVNMTSSGVILRSGDTMQATITYDGTTLTLQLLDTVTNKTFSMSHAVNIPSIVGSKTAYVGFTGSTGGLTSIQKLLTWTYTAN